MEIYNLLCCAINYHWKHCLFLGYSPLVGLHSVLVPMALTMLLINIVGSYFKSKDFQKDKRLEFFYRLNVNKQRFIVVFIHLFTFLFFCSLAYFEVVNEFYLFLSPFPLAYAGNDEQGEKGQKDIKGKGKMTETADKGKGKMTETADQDQGDTFYSKEGYGDDEAPSPDRVGVELEDQDPGKEPSNPNVSLHGPSMWKAYVAGGDEGQGPSNPNVAGGEPSNEDVARSRKRRVPSSPVDPTDDIYETLGGTPEGAGITMARLSKKYIMEELMDTQDRYDAKIARWEAKKDEKK